MRNTDQIQDGTSSIHVHDIPEWLMSESKHLSFRRGDFVMRCQDPISHIFLVLSGALSIMSAGENGQESVVVSLGKGCLLGEMEALVGKRHSTYSARCSEDAELVSFPAEAFVRWAREDGRVSWILAQMMAEKLYNVSRQSSTMTSASRRPRIRLLIVVFSFQNKLCDKTSLSDIALESKKNRTTGVADGFAICKSLSLRSK